MSFQMSFLVLGTRQENFSEEASAFTSSTASLPRSGLRPAKITWQNLAEVKRGMRGMRSCLFWRSKAALFEKYANTWQTGDKHVINTCKHMKKYEEKVSVNRNTKLLLAAPREVQGLASSNAQRLQCQSGRNLPNLPTKQLTGWEKKGKKGKENRKNRKGGPGRLKEKRHGGS